MTRRRRSDTKKVTKESKVLRYMRKSKSLSMKRAGLLVNKSDSFISFIEHGRIDITEERIVQLLDAYGFTKENFETLMKAEDDMFVDHKEIILSKIHKMNDVQIFKLSMLINTLDV